MTDSTPNDAIGVPDPRAPVGLCADIGGSFVKFATVDAAGEPAAPLRVLTPARDWDAFRTSLRQLCAATPPHVPLSVSIAGIVDPESGLALSANIPCVTGRVLAAELSHDLGRPVAVANDADCMVLAEALRGAGVGHRVVFGIVLGSGVGGGLVVDGRMVQGAGGIAGEWGHGPLLGPITAAGVTIPPLPCGCGQTGCLDTLGGAHGLERLHRYMHQVEAGSRAICAAWHAGEARATATIAAWLDLVAGPLAVMVNATGAGIVPVAGGLGNDTRLLAALDASVRGRILRRSPLPLVVASCFGDAAGLQGAALLLEQTLQPEPSRHLMAGAQSEN